MTTSGNQANRARCPCGATLTLPPGAVGKRVRCPQCKRVFVVQQPKAPPESLTCPACRAKFAPGLVVCPRCTYNIQTRSYVSDVHEAPPPAPVSRKTAERAEAGFWRAALASFVCFADPQNVVILLVVCAISILGVFAGMAPFCLGFFCQFIVYGWLCSFYINVLLNAASGEDELPKITLTEGWVEGIIQPAMMFMVSWLIVLLPAFIYGVIRGVGAYVGGLSIWAIDMWTSGTFPTDLLVSLLLMLAGAFCWPSAILLMSMFSTASVIRVDLWARTIIRTLPVYTAVCGLLGFVFLLQVVMMMLAGRGLSASRGTGLGLAVLGSVVSAYGWVVTMQIIGLYYLHYKHRFPWRAE